MLVSAVESHTTDLALWKRTAIVVVSAGLAFVLYGWTAAPGLTWSHQGADGGDFLAAAVTGGVPHPTGYPLYTFLLQIWLWMGKALLADASPARLGNLLSAFVAALTVGVTVVAAALVLRGSQMRWLLAGTGGLLWAVSPLWWGQSLITEIYTLHMLLVSLIFVAVLFYPDRLWLMALIAGMGIANNVTFVLLAPAVAYWLWQARRHLTLRWYSHASLGLGFAVMTALYLRIPLAASADPPPPVNWGYADNWSGLWWLVSGNAYRAYFADQTWPELGMRITAWARTLTVQYTPLGLIFAAMGLAYWDREQPKLRTFSVLWVLLFSLYAILYATRNSQIYLLPSIWLFSLWIVVGLDAAARWVAERSRYSVARMLAVAGGLTLLGCVALTALRMPEISLRNDDEVARWMNGVMAVVEPDSIVVSSSDEETFALWYAAWATGDLLQDAPGAIVVNDSLYQFDWYRRLQGDLYPDIPGAGDSFSELLIQNTDLRPIYFVEPLETVGGQHQQSAGEIWRFLP